MKYILIILFIVLFSISAKAEYNGYHITFTIENKNGEASKGYAYVASAYLNLDSLQNTEYLKRALDQNRQEDWADRKNLTYYKTRIVYNYISSFDQQKSYEYYLAEETSLPYKSIRNIRIDNMIDWSYLSGMSVLYTSDLTWIKSKPVKSYSFSSYLCDLQLFIHENNKTIEQAIGQIELLVKNRDKFEKEIAEKNSHGLETEEMEERSDKLNEEMEREIDSIIKQLNGYKIVVITFCTC